MEYIEIAAALTLVKRNEAHGFHYEQNYDKRKIFKTSNIFIVKFQMVA